MRKMADPSKPLEFDEPNNYNETPLFIAAMFRQAEVIRQFSIQERHSNIPRLE